MSKVNVYKDIEDIHPDISQVVVNMIKNLCAKTNEVAAKYVILIIEHMLKLFKHCTKENVSVSNIMNNYDVILKISSNIFQWKMALASIYLFFNCKEQHTLKVVCMNSVQTNKIYQK